MKNKLTGLRLASVLLSVFVALGMTACGSSPEVQDAPAAQAAPQPAPEAQPEPEPETYVEQTQDQPAEVASGGMMAPDFPERYVVVKGDTLWDISKRFLKDPWLWPSVWHINPKIRNPHLIYPGDIIVMYVIDGKPYITLDGQAGLSPNEVSSGGEMGRDDAPAKSGLKVVKLAPSSRVSGIQKAISTIPMANIRPFLDRPRVVTENELEEGPYIVSSYEEHLISGTGNRVYARRIQTPLQSYNIVRPGKEYIDPETDEVLGYEAIYLADARLIQAAEDKEDGVSSLVVTKAFREVLNNDVLVPYENREEVFQFTPRAPGAEVKGQIIDVFNGVSQIGQYMVVVLNRGERHGLAPGHVLSVVQTGTEVYDSRRFLFSSVKLPDERAGLMMVFKTYDKMSYAIVMEANRALHVNDRFENP